MVAAPNTTKEKEGENLETTPQAISDEDKKKVEQDEQNLRTTKEEKTQSQAEQKKEVENKKEELNTPDKNPNALQPVKVKSTSSKEEKPPQTQNEEKIEKALEDTTESADEKKKEKEKKSEKKGIPARFFGGLATISG
jgi:hypothetical protein